MVARSSGRSAGNVLESQPLASLRIEQRPGERSLPRCDLTTTTTITKEMKTETKTEMKLKQDPEMRRAVYSLYRKATNADGMKAVMDIDSVDAEFDMDWSALLADKGGDRSHDFVGIHNHLDRSSYPAKMGGCFVPRFVRK